VRFLLFDRVTSLTPGLRIEGVKCLSLTEESLRGHHTRAPRVPGTLLIESMIQLLAWCAIAKHEYRFSLVLSVLEDVDVPGDLAPGHRLDLVGELTSTNPRGSAGTAWASIEGRRVARVGRVLYAHLPNPDPGALRQRFVLYGGAP
jgi:3-hydroxyacyl-[acyl-carrier-protein] dehydratase